VPEPQSYWPTTLIAKESSLELLRIAYSIY